VASPSSALAALHPSAGDAISGLINWPDFVAPLPLFLLPLLRLTFISARLSIAQVGRFSAFC